MEELQKQHEKYWEILGINFANYSKKKKLDRIFSHIRFCVYFVNQILFAILNFPFFDYQKNVETYLFQCSVGFATIMYVLKYLVIYTRQENINLIRKRLFNTQIQSKKSIKMADGDKSLEHVSKYLKYYRYFLFSTATIHYAKYFFDLITEEKISLFNLIYFFWKLAVAFHIIIFAIAYFSLQATIIFAICIEFKALRYDLQFCEQTNLKLCLKAIILRQEKMYKIVKMIDRIFSFSYFFDFVSSSLIVAFNLVVAGNLISMIIGLAISATAFLTVVLPCYLGQIIRDASEGISTEIYSINWDEIKDIKLRKTFLFMLMRAQKPATLTMFKFFDASLLQLGKVILLKTF